MTFKLWHKRRRDWVRDSGVYHNILYWPYFESALLYAHRAGIEDKVRVVEVEEDGCND